MECEEMRGDSEVEIDSDHDDVEGDGSFGGGWLGHSLYDFHTVPSCLLLTAQCHSLNDIEDSWVWCCRHLPPKGHNKTICLYDYRADGLLTSLALEEVTMLRDSEEERIVCLNMRSRGRFREQVIDIVAERNVCIGNLRQHARQMAVLGIQSDQHHVECTIQRMYTRKHK